MKKTPEQIKKENLKNEKLALRNLSKPKQKQKKVTLTTLENKADDLWSLAVRKQ